MKFHHIVEINDPLNPLIDPLSREQVWRGLVLRAEAPKIFVPYLDDCRLFDRRSNSLSRELRYGELVVLDTVTYTPMEIVRYQVPAQKDIPASSLVMSIEEPQADLMFVRFEYDDGQTEAESAVDAFYNDFRHSAYKESDIDTIRIIRQMAEQGHLDGAGGHDSSRLQ
ncbi:SRPBCC family protein [soil metagenome]